MPIPKWNPFGVPTSSQVIIHRDIPYASNNHYFNQLDLFTPKSKKSDKFVVFVHGGAWVIGSRTLAGRYQRVGVKLAEGGIPNAVISYRLATNYKTQVKDVIKSIQWVQQSSDFGNMKIVLCGESAGGHLISVAALDQELQREVGFDVTSVKGVVGLGGVYDINLLAQVNPILKHTIVRVPFGMDPAEWRKASPVNMVHTGAPPFLLINSQWDFHLHTDTLAMENKLKACRVPVEKMVVNYSSHMTNLLGRRSIVLQKVCEFVHSIQ